MTLRIFAGCGAALFSFIIFGLEMSIATTGSGADASAGIWRERATGSCPPAIEMP